MHSLLEAARSLSPRIRGHADVIEAERGLPQELVQAMARAGFFRMLVPRAVGGGEVEPIVMIETLEELARADGSTGWIAMVGATSGLDLAFLEVETAREVFRDPDTVLAGVVAPMGTAVREGDGYRARGRWPFASGVEHSLWRMGGVICEGEIRHLLFHRDQTKVEDTWHVSGMRGTGSHDMIVEDVLVPASRSVSLTDRPRHDGALYRFPLFGLLSLGIAAVALGIARASIEALIALAKEKRPGGGKRTLAERESTQSDLAKAEAMVRAARAFLCEATEEAQAHADRGELSLDHRASLRLAATHATRSAAGAVDLMYDAGGGSSIYSKNLLQRCFRDVHVATQHAMVAPAMYAGIGRVMLNLTTEASML